ncbi:MAG: carotenoid oxygenase family protein [Candidatus Kapabacteria bacterium]|nr:carotenoid oxygenase family protein [Candidatus Kapabacteria bacterium]
MASSPRPLVQATRASVDVELTVHTGEIPQDWYGSVFINSSCGTVNSTLPFAPGAQEYDSSVMNGDGYMWRFDLAQSRVQCTGRLLKPPCYYADSAAGKSWWGFKNMGISRMSFILGFRDEVSTAITPFKMPTKDATTPNRFLACYDAGRPWEFDPVSLRIIAPAGSNTDWTPAIPTVPNPKDHTKQAYLFPFQLVQSTAHPSYDPYTGEIFLVNYTKSLATMLHGEDLLSDILKLTEEGIALLDGLAEKILQELYAALPKDQLAANLEANITLVRSWLESRLETAVSDEERIVVRWFQSVVAQHDALIAHRQAKAAGIPLRESGMGDEVILKRWNGKHGAESVMDSWQVVDTEGNNLRIFQCMHQTSLSEHYLILSDSTFKFSLDLMMNFNSPFGSAAVKEFCRIVLSVPQEPYLDVYIVPRPPLRSPDDHSAPIHGKLVCYPLNQPIPLEAVHYSADYDDSNDTITLHLAHNSAACLAEWVRTFDTLAYNARERVQTNVIGLPSAGEMDIGRIGKCVITVDKHAQTATQKTFTAIWDEGNLKDIPNIGIHTWGVGLYTYRNIVAADEAVKTIRHIYWSCYGFDPRLQTTFIEGLYYFYKNRIVDVQTVQAIAKEGIPFVLVRQNTATMKLDDYYQFAKNVILKSVQFVPRSKDALALPEITDAQMDGYIFTTVLVCTNGDYATDYECQIWIFQAWNLAAGPCCILTNPELDYAFTLHSAWVDDIQHLYDTPTDAGYSVEDDYNPIVENLLYDDIPLVGEVIEWRMKHFFRKNVYKPFNA